MRSTEKNPDRVNAFDSANIDSYRKISMMRQNLHARLQLSWSFLNNNNHQTIQMSQFPRMSLASKRQILFLARRNNVRDNNLVSRIQTTLNSQCFAANYLQTIQSSQSDAP